jgi:hypothetical protein
MMKNIIKIALLASLLMSVSSARNWMGCAVDVCRNMDIRASSPYDCWDKLADKYAGGSTGSSIVYPMCDVAEALAKKELGYSRHNVANCAAAIARNMGIYISNGSGIGTIMCRIADKAKKTKSLK